MSAPSSWYPDWGRSFFVVFPSSCTSSPAAPSRPSPWRTFAPPCLSPTSAGPRLSWPRPGPAVFSGGDLWLPQPLPPPSAAPTSAHLSPSSAGPRPGDTDVPEPGSGRKKNKKTLLSRLVCPTFVTWSSLSHVCSAPSSVRLGSSALRSSCSPSRCSSDI